MITNIPSFVTNVFMRLLVTGVETYEVKAFGQTHKLERRFGNMETKIISIDSGPWMTPRAAQREFTRILRAGRRAEKERGAKYEAERRANCRRRGTLEG